MDNLFVNVNLKCNFTTLEMETVAVIFLIGA